MSDHSMYFENRHKRSKLNKLVICDGCGLDIPIGQVYRVFHGKISWDWFRTIVCNECENVEDLLDDAPEFWNEYGGSMLLVDAAYLECEGRIGKLRLLAETHPRWVAHTRECNKLSSKYRIQHRLNCLDIIGYNDIITKDQYPLILTPIFKIKSSSKIILPPFHIKRHMVYGGTIIDEMEYYIHTPIELIQAKTYHELWIDINGQIKYELQNLVQHKIKNTKREIK